MIVVKNRYADFACRNSLYQEFYHSW